MMDENTQQNPMNAPSPLPGKAKATGSLVCGIFSLIFGPGVWGILGFRMEVLALVGIVLAIKAEKEMQAAGNMAAKGRATAGMVVSIISLAIAVLMLIAYTIYLAVGITNGMVEIWSSWGPF